MIAPAHKNARYYLELSAARMRQAGELPEDVVDVITRGMEPPAGTTERIYEIAEKLRGLRTDKVATGMTVEALVELVPIGCAELRAVIGEMING